ncbi:MAG: orotidine-5'-phosphate decarboxylase [Coriobacteriia bacterium]|nr:orotidine-5'-phosphate decarboxylase [Coriobacteriia bacterium]
MDVSRLATKERLICALDTADVDEAKAIIDELDGVVSFFKIGITLHLSSGLEIVNLLLGSGKRVFLDLKYFDVPKTVERAVREAAKQGITFLTVHGNNAIIQAAAKGRGESGLQILVVTVLTSLDRNDLVEMGYEVSLDELVLARAQNALTHGADGVISSPREARLIKSVTKGKLTIVSPGIREADAPADDQKRTMSAAEAIAEGADFLVIGRPITTPTNGMSRREAAEHFVSEMQNGLGSRQ